MGAPHFFRAVPPGRRIERASAMMLHCGTHDLDLARPRVMGIVNVTPDSFSDGGLYAEHERALQHARQMVADGADIIDVGGESTRPGAATVAESLELARVIPLVEALAAADILVSVDTSKPAIMRAAIRAGASMINDVRALLLPEAVDAVACTDVAVCLMHMRGDPHSMQAEAHYGDVVLEVRQFLLERALICETAGIAHNRILVDPGLGFGKTVAHNLALLRSLEVLGATGYPVLAGMSRKSTLGHLTGRDVSERMAASIAAALAAVAHGASIVRVHDVRETVDAIKVWKAVATGGDE
jgi:dihydropteroate synthase